jgi:hypothetical protein
LTRFAADCGDEERDAQVLWGAAGMAGELFGSPATTYLREGEGSRHWKPERTVADIEPLRRVDDLRP